MFQLKRLVHVIRVLKSQASKLLFALKVISSFTTVQYDQTQESVYPYAPDSQQSHECGLRAQSVQKVD